MLEHGGGCFDSNPPACLSMAVWMFRFKSSIMLEHDCGCFGSNPPACLNMAVWMFRFKCSSMLEHGCVDVSVQIL